MRVTPIQNHGYNNIKFTGSAPVNMNWRENYDPHEKRNDNNPKGMPEWLRKSALFGLITLAVVNDPATKEFLKPESIKQQEKVLNEYFEDISQQGYSVSAYHLNRLTYIDKPTIKSNCAGNYTLKMFLDDGKKVEFDVFPPETRSNILHGYFKINDGTSFKYKAVFNPKNPEEFEVFVRNKENKKYIFGRTSNGELYRLENGKKIVLNNKNAKDYQERLNALKSLDNLEFFTNKNDMWRKLNLILLFLLTVNEWGHDMQRREEKKNK